LYKNGNSRQSWRKQGSLSDPKVARTAAMNRPCGSGMKIATFNINNVK
jgi:hypothetical protein